MKKALIALCLIALAGMLAAQAVDDTASDDCPGCATRIAAVGKLSQGEKVADVAAGEGDGISIEKVVAPEIVKGDVLTVTIYVTNSFSTDVIVTLHEEFGRADEIDMGVFEKNTEDIMSSAPTYYKVLLKVPASSKVMVAYKIKPLYSGNFKIAPTELSAEGITLESKPLTVQILCNRNKICEPALEENSYTCPQDCSPKNSDGICDMRPDGVCDPDCSSGQDSDCAATAPTAEEKKTSTEPHGPPAEACGNGICAIGENYATCPGDCPSGIKDGFCDKVKDGICDPDCSAGQDPDCAKPNESGLMLIALVVILVFAFVIAYKKRWLRRGR